MEKASNLGKKVWDALSSGNTSLIAIFWDYATFFLEFSGILKIDAHSKDRCRKLSYQTPQLTFSKDWFKFKAYNILRQKTN